MQIIRNFKVRPVNRIQYANLESEKIWSKKIEIAATVYHKLEIETVIHGVRPAMIAHFINPYEMDEFMRDMAKVGLYVVPLRKEVWTSDFSHIAEEFAEGYHKEYRYRCVLAKSMEVAEEFVKAHHKGDDLKIGELLGFPRKSCEFFNDTWQKGYHDPIWQQAENTSEENISFRKEFKDENGNIKQYLIAIKASDENFLIASTLRYSNLRILSHFPYSFDDKESVEVAKEWLELGRKLELEGIDELLDIMRLPYSWDSYKGYVEITTPVFKIVADTTPCFPKYTIWQESDYYPEEAPFGTQFPWKNKMFS